ncbi:MAG: hypothetical protein A3F72_03795 [Bacteroidetes bacterium RIFCSPLOWO2_12_FULL_35_15]|nr:MAG: hypothetical protein A3F72_03795 [Bacteroidetes bacterium RIFCSPLOWO2_12_FULL_35_15]
METTGQNLKMSNSFTPNKALSILQGKCPRCQSGKIFKYTTANVRNFTDMHENCPACGLHFEIEPGFFWGAMYVSYTITTGMMLVLGGLTYFVGNNPDFWWYVGIICAPVILSTTLLFRYSRILMLYLFSSVHFDKKFVASK